MTTPPNTQPDTSLSPAVNDDPDHFDAKEWIMQRIFPDDPQELRRGDLYSWSDAAGFQNVAIANLGEPDFWEMRFERGSNDECCNIAQTERWLGFIARGCGCRFVPGQFVATVDGDKIAARFRLELRPPPQPQG